MDRTPKVLQAAARDAAARARLLAEALDALADVADNLSEVPQGARPPQQAAGASIAERSTFIDLDPSPDIDERQCLILLRYLRAAWASSTPRPRSRS